MTRNISRAFLLIVFITILSATSKAQPNNSVYWFTTEQLVEIHRCFELKELYVLQVEFDRSTIKDQEKKIEKLEKRKIWTKIFGSTTILLLIIVIFA